LGPRAREPGALLFAALVTVTYVGPLSIHMFLPALPYVRQALDIDQSSAQLTYGLAMLAMAFATVVYGSLSDRYGRLPVLLGGLALFTAGAALAFTASSLTVLLIGRIMQGAGAACGVVLARAMVSDVYGADRLGKMIAYLTVAYVIGPLTAPPIGGVLIDRFGWQSILLVPAVFGLIAIAVSVLVIGETRRPRSGARTSLIGGYGRLLGDPVFMLYVLCPAFFTGAFFAHGTAASYLMTEVLDQPASAYGILFMLGPGGFMLGNFLCARLSDRVPGGVLVVSGSVITVSGTVLTMGLIAIYGMTPLGLFVPLAVLTLGQGLAMPPSQAAAISRAPSLTGTASGVVMFVQLLFAALLPQLVSALYDGTATAMMAVVSTACVLGLACGIAAVTLARRRAN
jgi:DHA1 family bicyclomycin/chloramphenicol resistance-like MFS transporter